MSNPTTPADALMYALDEALPEVQNCRHNAVNVGCALAENGAVVFTVDSLAKQLHERACHPGDAADHPWCHDEAAAIIQAAKEAERE